MTTKAEAAKIGREIGMTIRWDNDWQEFAVYPHGTGKDHPSAYFTNCVDDAIDTARAIKGKE